MSESEIKNTEHGSLLYQVWKKIRCNSCCEEWSSFLTFYEWAMASGYKMGTWIQRKDISRPYSPENCILHVTTKEPTFTPQEKEWIEKWNKTVNHIRKCWGMEPLT